MAAILCMRPIHIRHCGALTAYKELHEKKDSARLAASSRLWACCPHAFFDKSRNKTEGCAMPIELLVPITIFVLGIVVSVSLSSLGIERIVEGNKK